MIDLLTYEQLHGKDGKTQKQTELGTEDMETSPIGDYVYVFLLFVKRYNLHHKAWGSWHP
jgi:hypothetical protein